MLRNINEIYPWIGTIDTIVGEPVEYTFFSKFKQENILQYNYEAKLHIYNDLFSLVDDDNIIYTYDLNNEEFLLLDKKIYSFKSINFLNNSLLVLNNNNLLTSYNLKNNNIFWKKNLSKFLSNKDLIIKSYVIKNTVAYYKYRF